MDTLLTITGPTACGKTALAVALAYQLHGEIISADSRQVFRHMDIGTGKDLSEYHFEGVDIPYHLIDIHDPGYEYNLYQFQNDFIQAFHQITARHRTPVLCGGTGMYVESVLRGYQLPDAPIDPDFRRRLEPFTDEELIQRLAGYITLHNHTDTESRDRLIRALEIQEFARRHPDEHVQMPPMNHLVIGVAYPRQVIIERIEARLTSRLQQGMIQEVENLLSSGVPAERLLRYGLEYRYLTLYLQGQITYEAMYEKLFTEIRRFAKRQMTWFRRMERNGISIHWLDPDLTFEQKVQHVAELYHKKNRES